MPALLEQRIKDSLKIHYGIDAPTLTLLPLGADMQSSVYKAETLNHASYFVKVKRGPRPENSALIIEFLCSAGIQHIIPMVKTIRGEATLLMDDVTLTVFPFVAGHDGFSRALTEDQWYVLGKVMRQIHEIKVPAGLQGKIRRESYSPKWRKALRALYPLMESEPSGDEIAVNLLTFMKKHRAAIHRLVDRAEQLAQMAQDQSPPFVLCHSDLHGGNILIGENDISIVDWDDPIMAPPERDLMFIGGGVANVWNNPQEEALFYKGYGETDVNGTLLAYYRHERIVEDMALYGQQLLLTTAGGQDRRTWYQQFIAQFEPQGVVEIAFKTDLENILPLKGC